MEAETPGRTRELVRCLACHTVYELPGRSRPAAAPTCPECGALEWLAVTIPLPETGPVPAA